MSTDTAKPQLSLADLFRELFSDPNASLPKPKLADAADELQNQRVREATARADEHEQRNEQRFKYARRFFVVSVGWLVLVGLIVLANGFACIHFIGMPPPYVSLFPWTESVLIALLTTTTLEVIGPAYLIARLSLPFRCLSRALFDRIPADVLQSSTAYSS